MENSLFHSELSMLTNLHEYQISGAGGKKLEHSESLERGSKRGNKKKTNGEEKTNKGL